MLDYLSRQEYIPICERKHHTWPLAGENKTTERKETEEDLVAPKTRVMTIASCLAVSCIHPAIADDCDKEGPRLPAYITTHFQATGGDNREGVVIEEGMFRPYYGQDADDRWKNHFKDGHPFNDTIKPAYNNYNAEVTAYFEMKLRRDAKTGRYLNDGNENNVPDEIEAYEQEVYEKTGYHVDILNYNPDVPVESYLCEDHSKIQIVNNVIYGNSLFTVILPPHWSKSGNYPVKLGGWGWGRDNVAMYSQKLTDDAVDVGRSVSNQFNGKGLIVVRSNTGGREGQGVHSNAMRDVGQFMEHVMSKYGADLDRVVTEGTSRGGRVALAWGANPDHYNYNTVAIQAEVPPLDKIIMPMYTIPTFPGFAPGLNKVLDSHSAYRSDYVDKEQGKILSTEEKYAAARNVLGGSSDIESAQSAFDYFSDSELLPSLRQKRINLTYGSHDLFLSMPALVAFNEALNAYGVNHRSVIGYGFGHNFVEPTDEFEQTLIDLVKGKEIKPYKESERFYYMPKRLVNNGNGTKHEGKVRITDELIDTVSQTAGYESYFPSTQTEDSLGFSVSIPYRVKAGEKFTVTLVGESGKSWELWIREEQGYKPVYSRKGVFGEPHIALYDEYSSYGSEYAVFTLDADVEPGYYEWFFKYDGKEIPNRFTPYVSRANSDGVSVLAKAVTNVTSHEPRFEEYYHPDVYCKEPTADNPSSKCSRDITFGVDQYHPQLLIGNHAPTLSFINDVEVHAGGKLYMYLHGKDEDGDELVYDLRNAQTGAFVDGVNFNGLTGELTYTPTPTHVGERLVKAIVSDGKGGKAEQIFSVKVID